MTMEVDDSHVAAALNALISESSSTLSHKDLVVFIPPFHTSRKGINKDVPLGLTEQMVKSNISTIKIVAANSLNRRITTASNMNSQEDSSPNFSYVLSLSISLTFEGQNIPNYVYMYYVRYSVSPYIARVSRCNYCFRFEHIQINCKNQSRCVHCGDKGHVFSTDNRLPVLHLPKCANCQGEHRADSSLCPEFATQKEIRKYTAYRNISLLDAKEIFKGNRSPPPFSSSSKDFPNLSSVHSKSYPSHCNSHSYSSSSFTSSFIS
ncbi:hypothetical protein ACFW04_014225 [Cataglyphis niger]